MLGVRWITEYCCLLLQVRNLPIKSPKVDTLRHVLRTFHTNQRSRGAKTSHKTTSLATISESSEEKGTHCVCLPTELPTVNTYDRESALHFDSLCIYVVPVYVRLLDWLYTWVYVFRMSERKHRSLLLLLLLLLRVVAAAVVVVVVIVVVVIVFDVMKDLRG